MAKPIKATPTLKGKEADKFLKKMLHEEKRLGTTKKEKAIAGKFNWKEFDREVKRENKILEKWMIRNFGYRCPEYYKGCIVCERWKLYDQLKMET